MPKKRLLLGLCQSDWPLPKKLTFVLGFRPQFLALGASSLPVTPISGHAYVTVSNNKQYTVGIKKRATLLLSISLPILTDF